VRGSVATGLDDAIGEGAGEGARKGAAGWLRGISCLTWLASAASVLAGLGAVCVRYEGWPGEADWAAAAWWTGAACMGGADMPPAVATGGAAGSAGE
jgi:hypothetical protein